MVPGPEPDRDGRIVVSLERSEERVLIPADADALEAAGRLVVVRDGFAAEIPGETLHAWKALAGPEPSGAYLAFTLAELSPNEAGLLLQAAAGKSVAELRAMGTVLELELAVIGPDGRRAVLNRFEQPILLKWTVSADINVNASLLGVYCIAQDGTLEYVGGTISDGVLTAYASHFSKYAALEYDKSFRDIGGAHWASGFVKELAAKQIVTGVSDTLFAPERSMTRAEFAALLVRALRLEVGTSAAGFKDVEATQWYAPAVEAAHEAGLVQGRSAELFAPHERITREEMAVALMRAYGLRAGGQALPSPDAEPAYADLASIAPWAREAVGVAAELGFMQGRENRRFDPQGWASRAEAAKVIALLLNAIRFER